MTEREVMDFDVVIVGGGPAGLATAIHLANRIEKHNVALEDGGEGEKLEPEKIVLVEKGKEIGSHAISGAVMDPGAMGQLLPDWRDMEPPVEAEVRHDSTLWLSEKGGFKFPFLPSPLRNEGKCIVSLNRLARWMGNIAEEKGIQIFPGFPGACLRREGEKGEKGERVTGVQLQDAGLDKNGDKKGSFEAGAILAAKVTVLAEGSRGSLTKQLVNDLDLHGRNSQVYAVGVKEVWEVDEGQCPPGTVVHSMGYPLGSDTFGGGFIYGMGKTETEGGKNLVSIGLVVGLDYKDPTMDPHREFQRFKLHPKIRSHIEGGKMLSYGAKTLPEGGLFAMPRLSGDGFLIVGDAGGFLNGMRLKGIHLAIRSGMLAADCIYEGLLCGDFSTERTRKYEEDFRRDWSHREMRTARNFHQGFHRGRFFGLVNAGFGLVSAGRGFFFADHLESPKGHEFMQTLDRYHGGQKPETAKLPQDGEDGELSFDKLTDVYRSGTKHEEDQPCHLVVSDLDICHQRCPKEYGNPCQHFCPAEVYEIEGNEKGEPQLKINASNCVHCKTCDIMDPYQVINWVTPEGGGGPAYLYL